MKIYFDNNIFISIEDGEIDYLSMKEKFIRDEFVFSYAHIQELLEVMNDRENIVSNRMRTITLLTDNQYVFPDTYSLNFKIEEPQNVIKAYSNMPLLSTLLKISAINFNINRECVIDFLEIDLKRINNYKPYELIDNLNEVMKRKLFINVSDFINQAGNGFRDNVTTLFNYLDLIGFWKDEQTNKSNLARIYDASHTFFASACDIFVSNDRRARNKAKVVYSLYNVPTLVFSYDEFMLYNS